jgi:Protein of unknown function (DUF1574)
MTANRRELRRRGRASLLSGLAAFLLGQLVLALAIEFALPELRDPEYGTRIRLLQERYRSLRRKRPFTVVVLGSSRITFGLRTDLIEAELSRQCQRPVLVFNFGITGGGPFLELLQLERLLKEGIRPDLLLVEVVPPFLAGQVPQGIGRLPVSRFWLGELPALEHYGGTSEQTPSRWWQSWWVPCHTHRFALLSKLAPSLLINSSRIDWLYSLDRCGCVTARSRRTGAGGRAAAERARVEYAPYFAGFELAGPGSQALQALINRCRQQQLPAALVLMPEGSEFRDQYRSSMWRKVRLFLVELSGDLGAPLLDCREWAPDEGFSDSHHLTPAAAERFSRRFGREALLPFLEVSLRRGQPAF